MPDNQKRNLCHVYAVFATLRDTLDAYTPPTPYMQYAIGLPFPPEAFDELKPAAVAAQEIANPLRALFCDMAHSDPDWHGHRERVSIDPNTLRIGLQPWDKTNDPLSEEISRQQERTNTPASVGRPAA